MEIHLYRQDYLLKTSQMIHAYSFALKYFRVNQKCIGQERILDSSLKSFINFLHDAISSKKVFVSNL